MLFESFSETQTIGVARHAFRIDPDEYFRNLLLVRARIELDHLEPKVPKVSDSIDAFLKPILFYTTRSLVTAPSKPTHETAYGRLVTSRPQHSDVWNKLRIPLYCGIGHLKSFVHGSKCDADSFLFEGFRENRRSRPVPKLGPFEIDHKSAA